VKRPLALALVALFALPAAAPAKPAMGVYSEEAPTAREAASGFELVRRPFNWRLIEPQPGRYRWTGYDGIVGGAAQQGLTMFPFLLDAPDWAVAGSQADGMRPPRKSADFARFAAALVSRYGPDGSYWAAHPYIPRHPIRAWQIWNEPNLPAFWQPAPKAGAYVKLLRAAAKAIHRADRGATVVAAGLPESRQGIPQIDFLRALYKAKLEGAADALAIHAYAPDAPGVLALVARFRAEMARRRDQAQLWVTEFGWASGGTPSLFTVSDTLQAKLLTQAVRGLRALARPLRLGGLFVFRWQDPRERALDLDIWPYHAGLLRTDGRAKPALEAYRKALRARVARGPAKPGRLTLRVEPAGRKAVRVRCSRACTAGTTVIRIREVPGRPPQQRVVARNVRALPTGRAARVRLGRLAGREVLVSAYTAAGGADRVSRSFPRTGRP
jgi:polysaccharide biosynthesis protein PslG